MSNHALRPALSLVAPNRERNANGQYVYAPRIVPGREREEAVVFELEKIRYNSVMMKMVQQESSLVLQDLVLGCKTQSIFAGLF